MTHADRPSTAEEDRHEEAALWFSKLREAPESQLPPVELQAWQRFAADVRNRAAFEDVRRAARAVRRIRPPSLPSAQALSQDRFDGSMPISEWRDRHGPDPFFIRRWLSKKLVMASIAFASVVVIVLGGALITTSSAAYTQSFATGAGQMREVSLPDGSHITLGGRTTLSVHYSRSTRLILFEQGEALFTVAHSRSRPFQVLAGGGTVTAVGTQFNVKRLANRVTVTVTEGTVDVRPTIDLRSYARPGANPIIPPAARVQKGQQLTFSEDGKWRKAERTDVGRATAWREGRLEYRRAPLRDVVADLNRHFNQEIILGDGAVGDLQFTGTVFQSQSIDEWLAALEKIFAVRVVRTDAKHILIRSAVTPDEQ